MIFAISDLIKLNDCFILFPPEMSLIAFEISRGNPVDEKMISAKHHLRATSRAAGQAGAPWCDDGFASCNVVRQLTKADFNLRALFLYHFHIILLRNLI